MTTTTNKNRDSFVSGQAMDDLVRRVVEACGQTVSRAPEQQQDCCSIPNQTMASTQPLTKYTTGDGVEYTTDMTAEEIRENLYLIWKGMRLRNGMVYVQPSLQDHDGSPCYRVSESTQRFAGDLSDSWHEYDKLTDRQMAHAVRIVTEAITGKKQDDAPHPHTAAILEMFVAASENLKRPSVEFDCSEIEGVNHDGIVQFKYVTRGRNKGSVNISSDGSYGNNDWYGRIQTDGELYLSYSGRRMGTRAWLNQLLVLLNNDMAGMVKEYGTKSGRCCFCRKSLTDPQSVRAGFGATCAKHFGLLSEYRSA